MTWVQTATGQAVDLLRPDPATIRLDDIMVALARLPRFTGHTLPDLPAYNVLHHSLLVESVLPEGTDPVTRLAALLHDAHEAYGSGDITTPFMQAVASVTVGADRAIRVVQGRVQLAIMWAAGVPAFEDRGTETTIKTADLLALAIEKRDLMAPEPEPWAALPDPGDRVRLDPLGTWTTTAVFKGRLRILVREAGVRPLASFGL